MKWCYASIYAHYKGQYKYRHTQAAPVYGCEGTQWLAFHIQDSPADWHQSCGTGTDSIVQVVVDLLIYICTVSPQDLECFVYFEHLTEISQTITPNVIIPNTASINDNVHVEPCILHFSLSGSCIPQLFQ